MALGAVLAAGSGCPQDPGHSAGSEGSGSTDDPTDPTTTGGADETSPGSDPTTTGSSGDDGPGVHVVGGILEGLQGASVVLRNGDDLMMLDSDGAFAFPTAVMDGEGYEVEVETQPVGPDQACTVSAGEGVVDGADVHEIVVRCVTPIRHVVVLGIDGLGGQWADPVDMPSLDALRDDAVWTLQMQNALPTSSSTNWMSMIGGSGPEQHGVLSNGWQPGDSDPPPTMFATLRQHRPDAVIGIFHDWTDFDRLVEPGVVDHAEDPGDEQQTMDAATDWLAAMQPTLLFVHLDHVDHAGHTYGWGSPQYVTAVETADALLGQLRTALEDAGMWPYTALVVSADHGGSGLLHGADTAAERSIPFVLHTPQAPAGELQRDVRIWDIAATVLALLDVSAPTEWIASPVVEGLYDSPFQLPPPVDEIEAMEVSDHVWIYDDTGSGAFDPVSIWRPIAPAGYGLLGDVAIAGHGMPPAPALVVIDDPIALQPPVAFELIWQDTLSGGDHDVSLWNPIPPLGYVCMGAVAVAGYTPPQVDQLRCVHQQLVQRGLSAHTWDDAGSGALWDGAVWSCIPGGAEDPGATGLASGAFIARRHGDDPGVNRCTTLRADEIMVTP
ncbi:alkaline phosphatase family protein [Paraliomyxa miuraensis]|uniref:alkaline phosphatase family protein n=1 Tax=Paraliomyxa miuraensis TaxID=376150 RepID=UPI00224E8353|nr:alkaline phosphatase family protein [Paraliomyxa miuraensis]MCX4245528.1 alkaline phosphatase family protein [Paraliomyxa miuraensis]